MMVISGMDCGVSGDLCLVPLKRLSLDGLLAEPGALLTWLALWVLKLGLGVQGDTGSTGDSAAWAPGSTWKRASERPPPRSSGSSGVSRYRPGVLSGLRLACVVSLMTTPPGMPFSSISSASVTVSPNRWYLGIFLPTTPATT